MTATPDGARQTTVEAYVAAQPAEVRPVLQAIRRAIASAVPAAEERISYQMPTVTVDGRSVVHFAAWKSHIGLYPLPELDEALQQEFAPYATGKGTARFPLDRPIPYDLIARLTRLLVEQRGSTA